MKKVNPFVNSRALGLILILALAVITLTCDRDFSAIGETDSRVPTRTNAKPDCQSCDILFIGSSYLAYNGNDVVQTFTDFAVTAYKPVRIERRVVGGWRLYNHIASSVTLDKIREREWDYIILQGNSAFLSKEKWHQYIIPYLKDFRKLIKENSPQTSVIYMMPWAYLDGLAWIEGETDTYEQMQENLYRETLKVIHDIDIATAPAGWTWYTAINDGYEGDLYISDFNHQSKAGAYLAAAVFYASIFEETPPSIPYTWRDEDDPQYLRNIAYSMVMDSLAVWNIYD